MSIIGKIREKVVRAKKFIVWPVFILGLALLTVWIEPILSEKSWFDFLKTIVGSFAGATFAFMFAQWTQNQIRSRENKAAANLAVMTLARQLNDFIILKRGVEEVQSKLRSTNPNPPPWMQLTTIHYTFSASLRFDIKSLAFLLEKGKPEFLPKLILAENSYHDLASLIVRLNENLSSLQEKLASNGITDEQPMKITDAERLLGPALIGRANSHVKALLNHIDTDENYYLDAAKALEERLVDIYGKKDSGIIKIESPRTAQ